MGMLTKPTCPVKINRGTNGTLAREGTFAKLIAGGGGNVIRFGGIILVREAPAPNDVLAGAAKYSGLPQLLERRGSQLWKAPEIYYWNSSLYLRVENSLRK